MVGHQIERERRLHARTDVRLKGAMAFDVGAAQRSCIVKNISEHGACLDIGLLLDPPDRFSLLISTSSKAWWECKLVWRSQFKAGVMLSEARTSAPSEPRFGEAPTLRALRRSAFPAARG